jgi:3'-5' exoribonuclease
MAKTSAEYRTQARAYLERVIESLPEPYREYCKDKTLRSTKFCEWPASVKHHHVYEGGLLVHTAEVVFNALKIMHATTQEGWIRELAVAAVLHDAEKVKDYTFTMQHKPRVLENDVEPLVMNYEREWYKTDHAKRMYHVVDGTAEFRAFTGDVEGYTWLVSGVSVPTLNHALIEHAILAHHGQPSWGSPVEPQTPEAYILHAADMLSLKTGLITLDTAPTCALYSN